MSITSTISVNTLSIANHVLHFSNNVPNSYWFIISLLMVIFWLCGNKLSKFTKPGNSKLSLFVPKIGNWLAVLGMIMAIGIFFYYTIILVFAWIGFTLAEVSQFKRASETFSSVLNAVWLAVKPFSIFTISGLFIGLILSIYFNLFLITKWARGEGLHDVRHIIRQFKKFKGYSPLQYIDKTKGCFLGLDLRSKPIYISWNKLRETHTQVLGTTGTGKGVMMSLLAYQSALVGETVIWIDPKFDSFSPKIMRAAAKKAGKDFHMINLNPEQNPQFNLLEGMREHEIEELLVSGFDLISKGSDGDYHRGKDEDAAMLAAELAVNKNAQSIPALIHQCMGVNEITQQDNFWRKLRKLGGLQVTKTSDGLNLADAINKGSVIYIVGSTDNERVKMLQKMVLMRIMQIIKGRGRSKKTKPVCVVLDEFKHILSRNALTGLGAIRDFNSHFLLAHQSLGDLDSCASVTRAEAEGAVLDNTAIKIVYKLGNNEHAEQLSRLSGKKSIFVEQSNKSLDANHDASGAWRETHVPLIDTDILTHLPMPSDKENQPSAGALFGVGEAKIFYVHHINVNENMPLPKTVPIYGIGANTNAGTLI